MLRRYVSDHTKFIRELKEKNPQMEDAQLKGRALLWDKDIDREEEKRFRESRVPQQGYVYQNTVGPTPPESAEGDQS
ncbi:MAG: DUF3460 family protein [Casimicrobiaceae bacterium]